MDTTGLLIALGAALAALAIGLVLGWLAARRLKRAPRWLARLGGADPVTEEDLYELVDDADQQDLIDSSQKEMINNIIELADVTAGDIMTHRMDMVAVEEGSTCREVIAAALASGNSRLPLYRKTVDEVVGVLYVKDLLALFDEPDGLESPVRRFCRRAIYVPESRPASQLLLDFKNQHTLLAIVVDEYGGTAGRVSMEDILEEIVGD
ncbi:CBS domain-containing protein, partial [Allofournierella sp.]|uniref:CBS domain-containing protein n=1 Tax=Allofournierella sp. TaxID=1940256 RepID=UPI003AB8D501